MNSKTICRLGFIPTLSVSTLIVGIPRDEATDGYWLNGEYFTEGENVIISVTLHTAIPETRPYLYIFATLTNFDEEGFESVACTFR